MIRWLDAWRPRNTRGGQLLVVLLVAVIVPAACVLWFMNEAATNQAAAARRAVTDAYRGQLRLVRARLNASWQARHAAIEASLTGKSAADFKRIVTSGAAESAIVLAANGAPLYPSFLTGAQHDSAIEGRRSHGARAAVSRSRAPSQ
jgi:hypothetical protein